MSISRTLFLFLLLSIVLIAHPRTSEACEPVSSYAQAPDVVLDYDASLAPAAPVVLDAYVDHIYEDVPACAGGGCGDIHSLRLTFSAPYTGELPPLVRITFEDNSERWAMGNWHGQGTVGIVLPGYEDVTSPLNFQIATFSADGYPSLDVSVSADSQGESEPGCSAGGSGALHLGFPILLLLAGTGFGHRRRQSER